jgi:hypothetical protein
MQISLSRAYESLRHSIAKFAYETKSCAIIARIYEISGLVQKAAFGRLFSLLPSPVLLVPDSFATRSQKCEFPTVFVRISEWKFRRIHTK